MKIVQICEHKDCDYEPHQELVGKKATWFCCKKGFFKSLEKFAEHVANQYKCHVCNDKQVVKVNNLTIQCPAGCGLNHSVNSTAVK